MEIKLINIDEIIPYENNPRNNDDAVEPVMNSIKEFGFKIPMVIDKNNVIVAGHTRYKAAKKLGLKTVPCIIADDLNEEKVRAFRLADNKVSEIATWDYNALNFELENILDLDMTMFDFEIEDITDTFGTDFELSNEEKVAFTEKLINDCFVKNPNVQTRQIPAKIKFKDSMPLTANSKINYNALVKEGVTGEEVSVILEETTISVGDIKIIGPEKNKTLRK